MIRILHIVTYMGRGGLETMLMNYYRSIDRTKVQFDFLTHRDFRADYDDEIEQLGGRIYRISRLNPFSLSYRRELGSFFDNHPEYNIIHVHQDCLSGVVLQVARKHGIEHRIAHCHSNSQTKNIKYPIKLLFRPLIRHNATHLFACSKEAGKWMFRTDSFEVINNAIDAKEYAYNQEKRDDIRIELDIPRNAFVIGHVGRFAKVKNHRFLLRLFNKLPIDNKFLLLVGEGELRKSIKDEAVRLKLDDKVIFTGIRSDVSRLLNAMDVFVFPSFYEGLPLTIVEAQANGLPCIISDTISKECMVTDNIQRISLSDDINKWIDSTMCLQTFKRDNTIDSIIQSGSDIYSNVGMLTDFYLKLGK